MTYDSSDLLPPILDGEYEPANDSGNVSPCDHCGEIVTEDDPFSIFDGCWLVHEWCRDAWLQADEEAAK